MQVFQEKKIISAEELRQTVEDLDSRGEKQLGPMIVAKAWTDPAFKTELLRNAADAAQKLGILSSNFAPKPKPAGWSFNKTATTALQQRQLLLRCSVSKEHFAVLSCAKGAMFRITALSQSWQLVQ